ncbi:hypothetical protein OGAPHI_004690 [Ogataea philodendri]|uniref:Major facilitator superfamily (MFS) profile domain-containing protein n=1 Tax=Ogataea philodendri TaxID=1378263 RepID=A0A9P8T2S5_9ASCO|nr:uncharacterized protein OGAPHI_004690 [Ogataea philodendri]KAH3663976.1 hypothetical protein OGAPHI_004690 [Ogataea philodendri]
MSPQLKSLSASETTVSYDSIERTPRGVQRIERVEKQMNSKYLSVLIVSVYLCSWAISLDRSTIRSYKPYATSHFNRHSMLSTLTIATTVISAVCKPFVAKFSDLTSRGMAYSVVLVLYVIGFIVAACSPTISAYVIGSVFIAIGESGINLLNTILVADMTPLKWRSAVLSLLMTPSLCTTWVSGIIVQNIIDANWRWGYGMFAIITPVAVIPAILIIFWIEHRLDKDDDTTRKPLRVGIRDLHTALLEIDALGLLLIGFAFSLILLPCSLYTYASGGWSNPSMIAMECVGGVLLITYIVYDIWFAPYPLLPRRVLLNKTFVFCAIVDFFHEMNSYMWVVYFSSYTMVVLNLSYRDWTYLSNTETVGYCAFSVLIGLLFRITRRYKIFQVGGTMIRDVGLGLLIHSAKQLNGPTLGFILAGNIIISFGDAADIMGTQIAGQACVPHKDMASTISILSLFSSIGGSVGQAIAAAIWNTHLPEKLTNYVGDPKKALRYFDEVSAIYKLPWGSHDRFACIKAYQDIYYVLFCIAIGINTVCIIGSMFLSNFYLGNEQNAVEGEENLPESGKWYITVLDFFKSPFK